MSGGGSVPGGAASAEQGLGCPGTQLRGVCSCPEMQQFRGACCGKHPSRSDGVTALPVHTKGRWGDYHLTF